MVALLVAIGEFCVESRREGTYMRLELTIPGRIIKWIFSSKRQKILMSEGTDRWGKECSRDFESVNTEHDRISIINKKLVLNFLRFWRNQSKI